MDKTSSSVTAVALACRFKLMNPVFAFVLVFILATLTAPVVEGTTQFQCSSGQQTCSKSFDTPPRCDDGGYGNHYAPSKEEFRVALSNSKRVVCPEGCGFSTSHGKNCYELHETLTAQTAATQTDFAFTTTGYINGKGVYTLCVASCVSWPRCEC